MRIRHPYRQITASKRIHGEPHVGEAAFHHRPDAVHTMTKLRKLALFIVDWDALREIALGAKR